MRTTSYEVAPGLALQVTDTEVEVTAVATTFVGASSAVTAALNMASGARPAALAVTVNAPGMPFAVRVEAVAIPLASVTDGVDDAKVALAPDAPGTAEKVTAT